MRYSSQIKSEQLEVGAATKEEESDLVCPFASIGGSKPSGLPKEALAVPQQPQTYNPPSPNTNVRHSRRASDPITAELHHSSLASPPPSISESAPKCPIRYLGQHSPEEVAQYFENHKHELPRSHEICVKRYQSNEESIRRLDAKYGDLVSMIRDLGITHKPLLPTTGDDEYEDVRLHQTEGNRRLEKWAEGVNGSCNEADDGPAVERGKEEEDSERGRGLERDVKSDRRLMEVRVGESPSRPWGIPVPPPEGRKTASGLLEHTEAGAPATTNAPGQAANTKRKACPLRSQQQQPQQNQQSHRQTSTDNPSPTTPPPAVQFKHNAAFISHQPTSTTTTATVTGGKAVAQQQMQMVFTGPVFVGYPVEQAMALLSGTGGGGGDMQG
ncbi:hypothetical protein GP486_008099 [Trichoglossum hirsutum]|uniref:Uncharacterized protein n=1 Tax=Trichoglossum hirsutum TaxID=265104 RepID=A0A9P8IEB0_9PEZI|nr:hypothetical protein GP486_008099 [Trichoglossum hirsutum]